MNKSKISIEQARQKSGYTQEELAIKLGVKTSDVALWESDSGSILPLHLYALATVFDISFNNFKI